MLVSGASRLHSALTHNACTRGWNESFVCVCVQESVCRLHWLYLTFKLIKPCRYFDVLFCDFSTANCVLQEMLSQEQRFSTCPLSPAPVSYKDTFECGFFKIIHPWSRERKSGIGSSTIAKSFDLVRINISHCIFCRIVISRQHQPEEPLLQWPCQ